MPFTLSTIFIVVDRFSAPMLKMQANAMRFNSSLGSGFASAESSINSFSKVTGGLQSKFFNLKNAIAGFALFEVGKQIYDTMTKSAEGILELSHTSERLGISTQTLREFQYAAKLKGINPEALTGSFDKLNKNLGSLKMNMGSLHSFLKQVAPGLDRQLRGAKTSEQAFNILADSMQKIQDPSKRAALAQAAFGRGGMVMVSMLNEGSAGLKKWREEAKKTQGVISDKDIENLKRFAESQKKMGVAIESLKISIMTKLVPAITPLIDRLTNWITKNRELIAGKVKEYIDKIEKAIKAVVPFILFILKHIKLIATAIIILIATNALLKGLSITFAAIRYSVAAANFVLGIFLAGQKALPITMGTNKAALLGYAFATKIATAAQWLFSASCLANPVVLITVAILAAIAAVALLVMHWKEITKWFDNSSGSMKVLIGIFTFFEAPIVLIAYYIRSLIDTWEHLKTSFTDGGFVNGIKEIGKFLLSMVLGPLQFILKILGQFPGLTKLSKLSDKIGDYRSELTGEKKKPVNVMATTTQNHNDRYEEIKKQQFEISLMNKTDKNMSVKRNGGLMPNVGNTWGTQQIPWRND